MQELRTDRAFVKEQYSDAVGLRIQIETQRRYSHGDTDRVLDDATRASPFDRVLCAGGAVARCGLRARPARDLAATAVANGLPVYTCNPSDFAGIDGLDVIAIPHPDSP
jgi:hypothetical protein